MAGTGWDRLGQVEAVFEAAGPAIREAAGEAGARVREFHNEDPVWRLLSGPDAYVDVAWDEERPDVLTVRAIRWIDDKPQTRQIGDFARDHEPSELKALIADAFASVRG